jgi:hypothetical protein
MNTYKATKVSSTNDGLYNSSRWSYRGHELRYIQGSGKGYPWTYYPKGTDLQHRGCAARSKSQATQAIDSLIEQNRIADYS